MGLQSAIIFIPFVLITIASLVLSGLAWQRRRSPGSLIFSFVLGSLLIWLVSDAFCTAASLLEEKLLWTKISYLGIAWIGSSWLLFCLVYIYPERDYVRRLALGISIIPAVTVFLVLTNDLHNLIWTTVSLDKFNQDLTFTYGIWFWVFSTQLYILMAVGSYLLARHALRIRSKGRWESVALAAGISLPWIVNLFFLSDLLPFPTINLTHLAMAITGAIFTGINIWKGIFSRGSLAHTAVLENIGDGYLILNAQQKIIEASPVACRFLRLNAQKIIGKPAAEALCDWPSLLNLLKSTDQTKAEICAAGEKVLYLEVTSKTWNQDDQASKGIFLLIHDVTQRRLAEDQMRQSERLYRLVINASPVGIVLTNETGQITYVSPKVHDLFQTSADATDFLGQSVLRWVHPEDRTIAVMRIMGAIDEQVEQPPMEYRFLRNDGSYFWSEISSVPIIDDRGVSTGMLSIFRDVSARKTLEIRLQRNLAQQTFINNLLQILYRPHDLDIALELVLQRAGDYFSASRVFLCHDSVDGLETSITLEWSSAEIKPRARESVLVRYQEIPAWKVWMEQYGKIIAPDILSVPEDLAGFMTTWNVISMIALPVYGSEEQLYGFIGLDYCDSRRDWPEEELDILWSVCRIVSGAVAQRQVEEAEYRQRSLAEALHDTASALNSTLNLEEVLDRILTNLEKVVHHDSASIALVDDDGMIRFVRWRGFSEDGDAWMREARLPIKERSTYYQMVETGQPVIISDTWTDRRWTDTPAIEGIRSFAGAPIMMQGKLVGFINLDSYEPDHFTSELNYSLNVFADQAAIAIANARLYNEAHRRAEEMGSLYHIGLTLTAGLDMEQVLVSLFEQVRMVLPVDVFYVSTFDDETQIIELPLYYEGGNFMKVEPRTLTQKPGITGEVIRCRKTIYLPDTLLPGIEEKYNIIRRDGRRSRSYVGVPLIVLDRVVGVVSMQSFQANCYSPDQIRLLETIATQAAIAIQNARLYDQMKQMAITDPVTQLFTRRHFIFLGRSEVERALRYKRSLSVLMVDIDFFKKVNDTYGHSAGDQVLYGVAKICREATRNTDIIGRWGGEEFAIVLPEADHDGAALIAERIRRMVASNDISVAKDQVLVTVSIGITVLENEARSLDILIDQADTAMYKAKANGRNRVQFLEE